MSVVTAWMFYDSLWGVAWCLGYYPLCRKLLGEAEEEKRRKNMAIELKELLLLLSSYLQTGYSLEQAFLQTEREMEKLIEHSMLRGELRILNRKVKMNLPVEKAFYELAEQIHLEEAYEFAEILLFAKRLGGNYNHNVQKAADRIEEKIDIRQEIELLTAEKQLEMRIMAAMPLGMILYMKLSSAEFLAGLYHNITGIGIMSGCLILYLLMYGLGRKITQINV